MFAGTFDRLHEGHKHLLRQTLRMGRKVAIGLTTDRMIAGKRDAERIQTYAERERALAEFLMEECPERRWTIFPIRTVEGGADTMEDLEALVEAEATTVPLWPQRVAWKLTSRTPVAGRSTCPRR